MFYTGARLNRREGLIVPHFFFKVAFYGRIKPLMLRILDLPITMKRAQLYEFPYKKARTST